MKVPLGEGRLVTFCNSLLGVSPDILSTGVKTTSEKRTEFDKLKLWRSNLHLHVTLNSDRTSVTWGPSLERFRSGEIFRILSDQFWNLSYSKWQRLIHGSSLKIFPISKAIHARDDTWIRFPLRNPSSSCTQHAQGIHVPAPIKSALYHF